MADIIYSELLNIGIFVILAISLNLINGFTGMFSLGHAGFFGVGAYAAMLYMNHFAPEVYSAAYWGHFAAGLCVGAALAGGAGFCVGMPCLRLTGDYLAIATLAFAEILKVFLDSYRPDIFGGSKGLSLAVSKLEGQWAFWVIVAAIVLMTLLVRNLKNSAPGRAFLAIRENEIAAQVMGMNTASLKVQAFVMGAAMAGVAGGLFAYSRNLIAPGDFGLMRTIMILLMVVLGGTGSISGSIVGALILGLTETGVRYLPELGALVTQNERVAYGLERAKENPQVIFALMLIVLIRLRPQGILGMEEIGDLFRRRVRPANGNGPAREGRA
ncbi:MAG TPA: branched-chain amino acid ABC transporter permease [Candidatus Sumerlaeota bacterium]|nr:branched-chain amino acid ABC transporter permease [Candidatus Sumerlaeota bacterium]HPS00785.1 branched-chain amino acid ABC transporter permease [Candidatus Sumerlaeota bacterium]